MEARLGWEAVRGGHPRPASLLIHGTRGSSGGKSRCRCGGPAESPPMSYEFIEEPAGWGHRKGELPAASRRSWSRTADLLRFGKGLEDTPWVTLGAWRLRWRSHRRPMRNN